MTTEWPSDAAARSKLCLPKSWKAGCEYGRLEYHPGQRLVKIVDNEDSNKVIDVIDMDDMIGASLEVQLNDDATQTSAVEEVVGRADNEPSSDRPRDTSGTAVLHLYVYPRENPAWRTRLNRCGLTSYQPKVPHADYERPADASILGTRLAANRTLTLAPAEDLGDATAVVAALQALATRHPKSSSMLVIVNPKSGPKKNGEKLARDSIVPMLEQAGLQVDVCVTTHAGHAQERMTTAGEGEKNVADYDGLVVVGGDGILHEVVNGLQARSDAANLMPRLKIGVIGCGTANGYATSVAVESKERYGPTSECFLICKGQTTWADTALYETTNNKYTSFLTYSWGMVADIDIESEKIHFLGEARFDVWAVWRIISLRKYEGRFTYLPAANVEDKSKPIESMPALGTGTPADWETLEGDFYLFWASQVTHASMSTNQSPNSRMQDGIFQVMMIRKRPSRATLLKILLAVSNGAHLDIDGVEFVQCTAYRLEPLSPGSFNDVDGEKVEDGPIQAHVIPCSMQIFCNSIV